MPRTAKNVTKEVETIGVEAKLRFAPYEGRICQPNCGSRTTHAGFLPTENFVRSHGGKLSDISISGQESNATTRRLAIMNLAIHGIEPAFGTEHTETFRNVQHPDLRADYVFANPPDNDSNWFRKDNHVRWQPSREISTANGRTMGKRGGVHHFADPLPKLAAKIMAGKTLKEFGFATEVIPTHHSVKKAIFPFSKFPGVDAASAGPR